MDHDIAKLDKNIRGVRQAIVDLNHVFDSDSSEELLKIIRRPGWTTPAEYLLTNAYLESVLETVRNVKQQIGVVVQASKEIASERVGR